jgi:tetratricopeptide (TPR) repeat protein
LFSCLSVYPGTRDFHDAEAAGWLDREVYFTGDFQEFKVPFDASPEDGERMARWFDTNKGLKSLYREGVDERRAILARLGDHAPAHLDLGVALYEAGSLDEAEVHLERALALGYALPGVAYAYLACVANARGDVDGALDRLQQGIAVDPQHPTLLASYESARAWIDRGGAARGEPLALTASNAFHLLERTAQPTLPGPLPNDFAVWKPRAAPSHNAPMRPRDPDALARARRSLPVL